MARLFKEFYSPKILPIKQKFYSGLGEKERRHFLGQEYLSFLNGTIYLIYLTYWDYALVHTPDLDFSKQVSWLVQSSFTKKMNFASLETFLKKSKPRGLN